ncbi:serum amyloid A-5 protein-like [Mizuhopecten yessoensis]|uniref:Serum amyloid A protein n=1 Tax=Mizuhopecten yessoensis TaxID=6573 RepID=A0A210Q6G3_MIZYE|nr:serum amyloid A-5 protein-like [Mizuhopecten yessoensis]OWF44330.1 Serum amyloid A protein [Mizuhopecten yessoensis]
MKVSTLSLVFTVILVACLMTESHGWLSSVSKGARFVQDAYRGTRDMYRGYRDMRRANWRNSDKYFHARANYDAARHGPGGRWAARVISDARENWQGGVSGRGAEDTRADQEANEWGRNGGDPNRYRPRDLPDQY